MQCLDIWYINIQCWVFRILCHEFWKTMRWNIFFIKIKKSTFRDLLIIIKWPALNGTLNVTLMRLKNLCKSLQILGSFEKMDHYDKMFTFTSFFISSFGALSTVESNFVYPMLIFAILQSKRLIVIKVNWALLTEKHANYFPLT